MRQSFKVFTTILVMLVVFDVAVAAILSWSKYTGRFGSLVTYFDYGRSVPGKLEVWKQEPNTYGNLFDVAWMEGGVTYSREQFEKERDDIGPVLRSYGMSFVNNILEKATEQDPKLIWDSHAGPGAPPNYTYAFFEDDRANRRKGDIVVLGILSAAIPPMAALSNRTWAFEQPAPFTYPIYLPQGEDLVRISPHITSAAQERTLASDPAERQNWYDQLRTYDAFYSAKNHGWVWLDHSPLARLVRRSVATSHVKKIKTGIVKTESYPYRTVLQRMVKDFATTARTDGQMPIVMLVQNRNPQDEPDLLSILKPVLEADDIPYFATAEHFDPNDPSGFVADGHYRTEVDRIFGKAFLNLLEK